MHKKQENIVNLEIFVCSQTILLSVFPVKKPTEIQLHGSDIKLIKIILARIVVHQKRGLNTLPHSRLYYTRHLYPSRPYLSPRVPPEYRPTPEGQLNPATTQTWDSKNISKGRRPERKHGLFTISTKTFVSSPISSSQRKWRERRQGSIITLLNCQQDWDCWAHETCINA